MNFTLAQFQQLLREIEEKSPVSTPDGCVYSSARLDAYGVCLQVATPGKIEVYGLKHIHGRAGFMGFMEPVDCVSLVATFSNTQDNDDSPLGKRARQRYR